jgi:Ras family protein T1
VVCVVYALDNPASFDRVTSFWLPMIRESLGASNENHGIPVVVVGNKVSATQKIGWAASSNNSAC